MSNALAIAAVTSVLTSQLRDAFTAHQETYNTVVGARPGITSKAPDLVTLGDDESPSLNVYFYGVTPNQGWRNAGLPTYSGDGQRLVNPPLALDLHYLITAYCSENLQAEVLLGYAMQHLHEVPLLDRDAIRNKLSGDLEASGLADQVELIKITPEAMSMEEISKLWTAFQASYRPSAAYRASVVLIEAEEPVRSPLPVLTRGPRDAVTGAERGPMAVADLVPPYPALTGLMPPNEQPVAQLGETIQLLGHHLDGTGHAVVFTHTRLDVTRSISSLVSVAADEIAATIPGGVPAHWPAGVYTVHVALTRDGAERVTNALPLALAPTIDVAGIDVGTVGNTTTIEVPVAPEVWPEQRAALIVGQREVAAEEHATQTGTLTFELEDLAPGTYFIRLRVDGVESVLVDRSVSPPAFDPSQQVTIP